MSRTWTVAPWSAMDGGISRLLHDFVGHGSGTRPRIASGSPALTAWETEESYGFSLAVPGLAEGDVEVEILDGVLSIRGRWPITLPEGATLLRDERPEGEFLRTVRLPGLVDESSVSAALEAGILRLTLPKRPEARPRRIAIGSAPEIAAE